jgi:hypothetical protein
MKRARKEFILRAHDSACTQWKEEIEAEFPKLFVKDEITDFTGKWIKFPETGSCIIFVEKQEDGKVTGYGVNYKGFWRDSQCFGDVYEGKGVLATVEEVVDMIKEEAEYRGFVNGSSVISAKGAFRVSLSMNNVAAWGSGFVSNLHSENGDSACLFDSGKWADLLVRMTQDEIEKELGYKISIV